MLKDITLGQYYQTESVVHRLDPRVKLFATLVYICSLFVVNRAAGYAVALLFLAVVIRLSHVPFRFMVRGMKAILFLLVMTFAFNLFLVPGEAVFSIWKLTVTKEGIATAVKMAVRLSLLIIGSSVMTLTTTPNNLTDGLEKALKPLQKLHVPVHEIAMMMSIALQFIPKLMEKTDRIMKAQMARGASFDEGNLIEKAKSMVPLLVPLFVSAFQIADELAMAMENRCYHGGEGRTKMKPLQYRKRDYAAYLILGAYFAVCIVVGRILPWGILPA